MTLLDAKQFDEEKEARRKKRIILIVAGIAILAALGWWFRYLPEEHAVGRFFDALQRQDFKAAYAIWMHDPKWAEHPDKHVNYPFNEFYADWGPAGQWGTIKTHHVYGASTCPGPNSGVVVDVVVNDRVEHAQIWVEKSDHSLSYPPCELVFH